MDCADPAQPGRFARTHGRTGRQRRRRAAHRPAFSAAGTLLTPIFPAPVNARTFVILRLLGILARCAWPKPPGGDMPADQETIRYTGCHSSESTMANLI